MEKQLEGLEFVSGKVFTRAGISQWKSGYKGWKLS